MSYKVKSLIYLICFIASVLLYAQMDSSESQISDNVQLVQTESGQPEAQEDPAL